jgi:hypothetical protein
MKPGDLVRIDLPGTLIHGSIGIIIGIDESKNRFPHNCIYYNVLTTDGKTAPFRYGQLINSTDGYFENDAYFLDPNHVQSITLK